MQQLRPYQLLLRSCLLLHTSPGSSCAALPNFSRPYSISPLCSMTVQPVVGAEREVFYRERAAAMYATGPFALVSDVVSALGKRLQTVACLLLS